jgi:hypothetical protein
VAIEDLYLVAEPNHDNAALDASTTAAERMESLRRVLEQRLKRVAERELLRQAINETTGDESGSEGSSMAERLGRIVLNNLQVTISNVYARFEDVPDTSSMAVKEVNVDGTAAGAPPQRFSLDACVRKMMQGAIRAKAAAWVPGEGRETGCILDEAFDFQAIQSAGPEDEQLLVDQLRDAVACKPRTSTALRPVAMGVKMSELRVHTIDDEGRETFQTEGVAQNKEIRLRSVHIHVSSVLQLSPSLSLSLSLSLSVSLCLSRRKSYTCWPAGDWSCIQKIREQASCSVVNFRPVFLQRKNWGYFSPRRFPSWRRGSEQRNVRGNISCRCRKTYCYAQSGLRPARRRFQRS